MHCGRSPLEADAERMLRLEPKCGPDRAGQPVIW